jgi:hypothetical protein
MMRPILAGAAALGLAALAGADGFHNPPFQGVKPEVWEQQVRERLRVPKVVRRTQVTGPGDAPAAPPEEAPKGPPLTTEELGGVIVHLIDLLRYLDPVNVNPTEFPEVAANIAAYRAKVKELLADLGPKGVGYLVEALINELRLRRKGEGRRVPAELLGRPRANRDTWGTSGNDEMLPAPTYVDDLCEVLRLIGWDALREALRRQGVAEEPAAREDLEGVLVATATKWPHLFRAGLADEDAAVRRSTQDLLERVLRDRLGGERALATALVDSLVRDLRALEEAPRLHAQALLRAMAREDFGADQLQWTAWWAVTAPVLAHAGPRAVPELIECLAGDEALGRVLAARHLRRLCDTDCGMKEAWWAAAEPKARATGQQKWRAFWESNATRLIEKAEKAERPGRGG